MVLDAAVAQPLVVDRAGRPAQDGGRGPVGAIHERQHGDDHRDRQPDERAEHQDPGEAEDGEHEVRGVGVPQAAQRPDVDQVGDGGDDDRPQHRLGQVVEQRHEEQHRHHEEAEEDDARELRLDARRVGHRRPREAGVDGEPLEQARAEVGDAERDELLVGVHLVVVLGGEGARAGHRLREADERQGERVGQQVGHVAEPEAGNAKEGRPSGMVPTIATPWSCRLKTATTATPSTTATSMAGTLGAYARSAKMTTSATTPTASVDQAAVPELRDEHPELAEEPGAAAFHAQQLGELADADDQGEAGDEAGEHRTREEVGDEARRARARRPGAAAPTSRASSADRVMKRAPSPKATCATAAAEYAATAELGPTVSCRQVPRTA